MCVCVYVWVKSERARAKGGARDREREMLILLGIGSCYFFSVVVSGGARRERILGQALVLSGPGIKQPKLYPWTKDSE